MTKQMISRVLMLAVAGFIAAHSIGCETTEGAGKDIQKAGQGIENAADRNK